MGKIGKIVTRQCLVQDDTEGNDPGMDEGNGEDTWSTLRQPRLSCGA